jgi:hypothetical protein
MKERPIAADQQPISWEATITVPTPGSSITVGSLLMRDLFRAIERMPRGTYVRIEMETVHEFIDGEEAERTWLDASCWSRAPPGEDDGGVGEGGWPEPWVHPIDKHADRVLFSVSSTTHENLARLLLNAIRSKWPTQTMKETTMNEQDDNVQIAEVPATWRGLTADQLEQIASELGVTPDPDVDTGDACIAAIGRLKNNGPELGDDPQVSKGDTLAEAMVQNRDERATLLDSLTTSRGIVNRVAAALNVSQWNADGIEIVEKAQRWSGFVYALKIRLRNLTEQNLHTIEQLARISEVSAIISQLSAPTTLAKWVADHPASVIPPSVVDTASEPAITRDLLRASDVSFIADAISDYETPLHSLKSSLCILLRAMAESPAVTSEFISMMNLIIIPYLRRLGIQR